MKRLLPAIMLVLLNLSAHAQDYSCFLPDSIQYFKNKNGHVRGIRIDSVITLGAGQIFYPFKTARGYYLNFSPLDSNGGSWLGGKVTKQADGTFLFDNNWGDTVVVKTQAVLGDDWIFYHDLSSYYYKASVTAIDTMSFLGITDSVKKITVSAYDGSSINTTDSLHGFEIILSKSHGFVQVFDFYTFPYHPHDTVYYHGVDYYLDISLSYNQPGPYHSIYTISDYDYISFEMQYDRNVGDVYQYYQYLMAGVFTNCCPNYYLDTINSIITIGGSPWYITSGWRASYTYYNMNFTHHYTHHSYDTMYSGIFAEVSTLFMPEEIGQSYNWYYFPIDSSFCSFTPRYRFTNNDLNYNSMIVNTFEPGSFYIDYKTGLGMVHAYAQIGGEPTFSERKLMYYNQSGFTCGFVNYPHSLSVSSPSSFNLTQIYPNPTHDYLTIETPISNYKLSLINTLGQLIYTREACTGNQTVDVSSLVNGIYYLRIETAERQVINKKVIVQH